MGAARDASTGRCVMQSATLLVANAILINVWVNA